MGARAILELGTLAGYSTIWLARALPQDGARVVTLEAEPDHAVVARANLEAAGDPALHRAARRGGGRVRDGGADRRVQGLGRLRPGPSSND
jgi:predicted O-methyltransferase YrrM